METLGRRVWLVDVLSVVFGIGAWISVNGMWVELPLLVETLPEGWALPSYMSVVIQIANIGPICYSAARFLAPKSVTEVRSVYLLMLVGVVSSVLIAVFWDRTSLVAGVPHSTALLSLLFFLSLVDCTSSVLFMPFMARFRQIYLTSYLIGEGLSGFLPSIFALIQGVGGNPQCRNDTTNETVSRLVPYYPPALFSVSDFFFILFGLMVCSAVAFTLLNRTTVARRERSDLLIADVNHSDVATHSPQQQVPAAENQTFVSSSDHFHQGGDRSSIIDGTGSKKSMDQGPADVNSDAGSISSSPSIADDTKTHISKSIFVYLLFIQAWVCALSNGFLPSIQSYSCLPYGNVAYHLAVTLSNMANPVACLIAYFLPITSVPLISVFAVVGTCISSYIMALAALSPDPPLMDYSSGEALMVITWVLCVGVLTYVKVSVAFILRLHNNNGKRNLFWFGVSTQIGSAVGSIIAFVLVNVYYLFQSYYPCV